MRLGSLIAAVGVGLAAPGVALADGGPVSPLQGGHGIAARGGRFRYVADGAGRDTVVKQFTARRVIRSAIRVPGRYGIPAVDYNGSTTGLSADGSTLILAQVPDGGAPRTTRLVALGTPHLTVRSRIVLSGWFTVDAISPTGHWLYLIHYHSSNPNNYEVRAYDMSRHRLLGAPIVDPRERDEAMRGVAVTRATSADGRWDYTLYLRPTGVPFIHALDTVALRAVCIDLPSLEGADMSNAVLRLGAGGSVLRIEDGGITQATVDTATYAVTQVAKPLSAAPLGRAAAHGDQSRRGGGGGSDVPWMALGLVLVGGGAFATAAFGARRRARTRIT